MLNTRQWIGLFSGVSRGAGNQHRALSSSCCCARQGIVVVVCKRQTSKAFRLRVESRSTMLSSFLICPFLFLFGCGCVFHFYSNSLLCAFFLWSFYLIANLWIFFLIKHLFVCLLAFDYERLNEEISRPVGGWTGMANLKNGLPTPSVVVHKNDEEENKKMSKMLSERFQHNTTSFASEKILSLWRRLRT